jgi:tetratricopeptide (TPR) repeat protein
VIAKRSLGVLLLFVGLAGDAGAQPKKDPNDAKAAAHYKQGRAYFKAEVWDKALEEYKQAYALSPRPLLLYHLGTVYEKLGDRATALDHYKRFLDQAPDSEGADQARMRVALITKELKAAEAQKPPPPAGQPASAPAAPPVVTQDPAPPAATPAYVGATDPYQPDTDRMKWVWIGGGAAAIAGGVALDLIPSSGDDYQLEPVDFLPVALYAVGVAAITFGILR